MSWIRNVCRQEKDGGSWKKEIESSGVRNMERRERRSKTNGFSSSCVFFGGKNTEQKDKVRQH